MIRWVIRPPENSPEKEVIGLDDSPLVSVVIPAHNAEKTLAPLLDSLLAQTWSNLQILITDDGSRDQTLAVARRYEQQDSRITVLSEAASGVSAARNRALPFCRGKYLRFADADDTLPPESIALQVARAEKDGADLVISAYKEYIGDPSHYRCLVSREDTLNADENLRLLNRRSNSYFYGVLWNKLYLLDLARDLRFDDNLHWGEDFAYNMAYLKNCESVSYMTTPVYDYRRSPQSATFRQVLDSVLHPLKNIRIKRRLYDSLKDLYVARGAYPAFRHSLWIYLFRFGLDL